MLTYIFNQTNKIPVYRQLYNFIKNDITHGVIAPEERLPSKRKLAEHLKISVITVEQAYDQLTAEGYIYSLPKKGYYATELDGQLNTGEHTVKIENKKPSKEYVYDFRTNSVNTECFPFSTWSKLLRNVLSEHGHSLLNKTDPKGLYELRVEIAHYLKEYRSINARPEQIIIGAGSEYLFNVLIQLLGRNRNYAVENPGYPKISKILGANGIEPKYIPMDSDGLMPDLLKNVYAVHVTPTHHFPLGIIMPVKRRMELLQWADKNNAYIVEDDYDSEFRYGGRPIPALQSLDRNGRVIYINTFAKNLAPSLRISYMMLPPDLMALYEERFTFYSSTVPSFEQYTLAEFMNSGSFERYINRMRKMYKERIGEIEKQIKNGRLKERVAIRGQDSGLHILLDIKTDLSEKSLIEAADKEGIALNGVSGYYRNSDNYDCKDGVVTVILGYSGIEKEKIKEGLKILEGIV
jgi:GntR family transcriptional regulator/MocR family aminotransferase